MDGPVSSISRITSPTLSTVAPLSTPPLMFQIKLISMIHSTFPIAIYWAQSSALLGHPGPPHSGPPIGMIIINELLTAAPSGSWRQAVIECVAKRILIEGQ